MQILSVSFSNAKAIFMVKIFLLSILLFSALRAQAAGISFRRQQQSLTKECLTFLDRIKDYNYGWIQVPEDWANPESSQQLNVFYYTTLKDGQKPVLFFNGGPNGNGHFEIDHLQKLSVPRNIGMIYIDQRGTGCSSQIPTGLNLTSLQRASLYASDSIVLDAEKLRESVFKLNSWSTLGHSYGVAINNRYIMMRPESLKSVFNYAGNFTDNSPDFFYGRLKAQRRVMKAIQYDYPDLVEKLRTAKLKLTADDCIRVNDRKVCGAVLVDTMFVNLSGSAKQIKESSIAPILDLANETIILSEIEKLYEYTLNFFYRDTYHSIQSILKQENRDDWIDKSKACQVAEARLQQEGVKTQDMLVNECRVIDSIYVEEYVSKYLELMPKVLVRGAIDFGHVGTNLKKYNINYYLYFGSMDGIINAQKIEEFAARYSSQVKLKNFSWLGHGGFRFEPEIWDDIKDY